jgi:hypothetical protein
MFHLSEGEWVGLLIAGTLTLAVWAYGKWLDR